MSNSFLRVFGFGGVGEKTTEMPDIYPMPLAQGVFVSTDVITIFQKILTDTVERTHGMTDDQVMLMWDNCVKSNSSDGLITLLAKAMADKQDLFLVYEVAVNVIRKATGTETTFIRADYEAQGESPLGVYVSFKNFQRADMIKFYLGLEYWTVASLHKSMGLSRAVQLKISGLRSDVNLIDADIPKAQALSMAIALSAGRDVLLDSKDEITTNSPDLTSVKSSIDFLQNKLCFYLNMPSAYLVGEQTGGLGTTGEGDVKAIERGLRSYFFSIIKPVIESLFDGTTVSYKSQDFRQIAGSMDVLKTLSLVDDSLLSLDNKQKIINSLFDLPEDAKGDPTPKPVAAPAAISSAAPLKEPATD